MRLSHFFVTALATTATASSWFGKAAYNKWHETELERWLSDNNVPYPTPADRKDLENLVKTNWQSKVVDPLASAGDKTTNSYESVKDWIFDSWTESQLKSFLDHNNIPAPQPKARDTYLTSARQNYDSIAKKLGEYSAYPGDWLYTSWTESDLKEFLDSRGWPAPQPSTRDKLIASVRRNARLASLSFQSGASSASASAESAQASLSDALFEAWSDSKLKSFLDAHGIPVPQGSKKNELLALARKHRAQLVGNEASTASNSASSAFGAATSRAGNEFAKATDDASLAAENAFNSAVDTWSESRLKAFLDARGVPVPQGGKKDELAKQVRLNMHKAQTGWSAWTFDTWTTDNLQKYLKARGKDTKKSAKATRDELVKQAQDAYASASKSGGPEYASVTSYLAQQTDAAKDTTFDTWSESDIKKYLDSYGISNYQGTTLNELRAEARKQYNYFKYGTSSPSGTIFERVKNGLQWALGYLQGSAQSGAAEASKSASSAASWGYDSASSGASVAASVGSKSATSVSSWGGKSASSAASVASKSASSAASVASKSASSAGSWGQKSASSAASVASKSASSAASIVSKHASSAKSEL